MVAVDRDGSDVVTAGLAALVRVAGGEAANDTLEIRTLAGDDDVIVGPGVQEVITPVVDLGADD